VLQETADREEIIERVAALDIGKAELVCCVRVPHEGRAGRRLQEVETCPTMTRSLLRLADRLRCLGVTRVVMEATSDYWRPVFMCWRRTDSETWLASARDVKHLPGRPKTGKLDAVWLCKVAERRMIRPSFVPPPPIRRLRDVTRYRAGLVRVRTAEKNRVEKLLEDAQIKLSVVASDIFGKSGRDMMGALIAGERNPKALAQLARSSMRRKISVLEEAFTGHFTDHHAFLLDKMLARIDAIDADIAELDAKIEEMTAPFAQAVARLDEIPGIGRIAAAIIVAEIGLDMTRFPTPAHLASWAKFAPGSKNPPGRTKARAPPATATPTWPASSAKPPSEPPKPIASPGNATGGSRGAAEPPRPSSPWAAPSWSSPGTCYLTPKPATPISAPASTTPGSTPNAASAPTSTSSKPSAAKSPSNPPPDQPQHQPRLRWRCAGSCRAPGNSPIFGLVGQQVRPEIMEVIVQRS
jgi:transposase